MSMDITNTDIVDAEIVWTREEALAEIAETRVNGESFFSGLTRQIEHKIWESLGLPDWPAVWDEHYADMRGIKAPTADRPELVSRMRRAGLTQQETADTLGVHINTVKNSDREAKAQNCTFDAPATVETSRGTRPAKYKPRAPKPEPAPDPASVNPFTGEVIDNERLIRQRQADEHQRLMDRTIADSLTAIIDAIDYLKGGEEAARIWLDNAYVREADFIPEQDRLTTETVQSAIDYLTTIKKGLHS
jgi:hypothetical protein